MRTERAVSCLAVGHVTLDAYPGDEPAGVKLEVGGSVAYAARTWQALGAWVRVVTAAGPDFPRVADAGWEVRASTKTTMFSNTYDGEGNRRQHLVSRAEPLAAPPEITRPAHPADVAFLCPVLHDFAPRPWIAALAGTPLLAAGLQGWLKHAGPGGVVEYGPRCDPADFRGLQVAFLSEEDLAGRLDWLDRLCAVVSTVYLTQGRAGARVFHRGEVQHIGPCPAHEVDPTGAGDTFAAATLWALAQGEGVVEAGGWGAAAASIMVEHTAVAPVEALRQTPERRAHGGAPNEKGCPPGSLFHGVSTRPSGGGCFACVASRGDDGQE